MSEVAILAGYRPTLLGRVVEMHATYYAREYGFGVHFERKVGAEMAEYLGRIDQQVNATFRAEKDSRIIGSVTIDGQDLGDNIAHLRWFIMDDAARGLGVGRQLMDAAMAHVARCGFSETHLWTFSGLDAARKLYESHGFRLVEEARGQQWGTEVMEQKFIR